MLLVLLAKLSMEKKVATKMLAKYSKTNLFEGLPIYHGTMLDLMINIFLYGTMKKG